MTDIEANQIELHKESITRQIVGRFLGWRLPDDFNPDGPYGGIEYHPIANRGTENEFKRAPSGMHLLNYDQAKAMVEAIAGPLIQTLADCAPFLKHEETPAQRIDRERRDCNSLILALAEEKKKSENAFAHLATALVKLSPDLADEIVARHSGTDKALDKFLEVLRATK